MDKHFIIDFDSTFTQVEALEELAKISLKNNPRKDAIYDEIENLTNLAMEGKLSFRESLTQRIKLLEADSKHLEKLIKVLKRKVSPSFSRNKNFFKTYSKNTLIVSGGFKEFIIPVVQPYFIPKDNVYANEFIFDNAGKIIGYNADNPLSEEGGKVKLLEQLKLKGELLAIGDGYSDFQLKESGVVSKFYAYTENVQRKNVIEKADHVTPSFDEFLYVNNLPRSISYPKNRILCLALGDIPPITLEILKAEGLSIRTPKTFEEKYISDVGILFLGEDFSLTDEQLEKASKLKVIGVLGDSKKLVNKKLANKYGIVIFDDKKRKKRNSEFIPRRVINFINSGDTEMSRNFPNVRLPQKFGTLRILHIHHNIPGVMAKINKVFAENSINIRGQFLMTKGDIGYVVTDIAQPYDKNMFKQLKKVENTVKFRIIY